MSDIIKKDFLKWIKTLDIGSLSDIDKKLLNILIGHFDILIPLGTAAGTRANKIADLIQQHKDSISTDLPELDIESTTSKEDIGKITKFTIGPFRGFSSKTDFDFDNNYIFIYGPNGSGKSSFCEGLEYALLGNVWEAEAKRISVDQYIKNGKTKTVEQPIAYYKTTNGSEKNIETNQELYQFAFIEKNRIDGFARITAVTPEKQKDRIAILFGLDAFSNFVDDFTDNFSKLSVDTPLQKEFLSKSQINILNTVRLQEIEKGLSENTEILSSLIKNLGDKSIVDKSTLKLFLRGNDVNSGIINKLQKEKVTEIPDDIDIGIFDRHISFVNTLQESIEELKKDITKASSLSLGINYSVLFEAVSAIEKFSETDTSICPACKTPISKTVENPFVNAHIELERLKESSELKKRIQIKALEVSKRTKDVLKSIDQITSIFTKLNVKFVFSKITYVNYTDVESIPMWLNTISTEVNILIKDLTQDKIDIIKQQCEKYNMDLSSKRTQQLKVDNEIKKYNDINDALIKISTTEDNLNSERQKTITAIKLFEKENEEILKQIENEQKMVDINKKYIEAYNKLITSLKEYRNSLPVSLSAGLADKAKEFYNYINSDDQDFEKLSELILPSKIGEKIYIRFIGSNEKYDALHILSEGHIKILGLSILLSKAVAKNLKTIIFDDIVNAVDDIHRDGIAELLIEHPDMKTRQLILTCHGEIFINKLEHKLGASRANKDVIKYIFYPMSPITRSIEVSKCNAEAGHYLLQATESSKNNNNKDAAAKCRQAVESMSHTLWRKLGKKLNINLPVLMRVPTSKPELSNVVDALTKEVEKISNNTDLYKSLKELKENYIWSLLNKGTHEQGDLPEFDKADIKNLIDLVEKIEKLVISFKWNTTIERSC